MDGAQAEHLVFVITLIIKLHSFDEQTAEAPARPVFASHSTTRTRVSDDAQH